MNGHFKDEVQATDAILHADNANTRRHGNMFVLEFDSCDRFTRPVSRGERFTFIQSGSQISEKVVLLDSGQNVTTSVVSISQEHVLVLEFFLLTPLDRAKDAVIEVYSRTGKFSSSLLTTFHLLACKVRHRQTIHLGLSQFSGAALSFELAFVSPNRRCSTIGISRFVVGNQNELSRINALSNYESRLENEVSHFSGAAYTHSMYGTQSGRAKKVNLEKSSATQSRSPSGFRYMQETELRRAISQIQPDPGEPVFGFAQRCLGSILPLTPPNFYARATDLSRGRSLRVLSLCAGAARIEEEIAKHCLSPIDLTLLDASEDLIQRAAARFLETKSGHNVRCLIGDINDGLPGEDSFDLIICVSALHHVANLELVLTQINERLTPDGEFWSIGEQIGRNGNRLWPGAISAANRAFKNLPKRYRKNAHTGKIDDSVPDDDFSSGCFEGIRSEELESALENYLIPVDVYKRNCFLWRLTDATYCDNFNLDSREDLLHVRELVIEEAMHWVTGGRGTEMHGVFRRKQFKS
ncbi:class I SAM-dependent methyltransferase [Burkholderia theae]|uniref:class I SAM-dependent methyltransferase n=1 Tax=Burkholderia theae TaxID=3143496 RepID=UPI003AFB40FB